MTIIVGSGTLGYLPHHGDRQWRRHPAQHHRHAHRGHDRQLHALGIAVHGERLAGLSGTSTITATIGGGFNSPISLSASGMPSGTTVTFNPQTIPAPGSGSSIMTITVGSSTPSGLIRSR